MTRSARQGRRPTGASNRQPGSENDVPIWRRGLKGTFGEKLEHPDFTDLGSFDTKIGDLDTVTKRPAMYKAANNRPVEVPGDYAIVGQQKSEVYGFVSESYQPVQDWQVLRPLYDAVQQAGVETRGVLIQSHGRLYGYVLLHDDSFKFEPQTVGEDQFVLGVRAFNSYTAETSFGAESFGVRMICGNFNIWGQVLGSVRSRHQGDLETLLAKFSSMFDGMLKSVPKMKELLENAVTVNVKAGEVEDLLWGLNVGSRMPLAVAQEIEIFAPEVRTLGRNAYTLYNAVTAYATWQSSGAKYLGGVEDVSRAAMKLLTENHDTLIADGRKAREEYEEKQREKADKKAEKKAAKAVA